MLIHVFYCFQKMYRSIPIPRLLSVLPSVNSSRTLASISHNVIYKNNNFAKSSLFYALENHYRYDNKSQKRKRISLPYSICLPLFLFWNTEQLRKEDDDTSDLIKTLKRSILLIQKKEFPKAEAMLHIALHQAQTIQHYEGITYVYDVMANLAFEIGDYLKAETLFKTVMNRLLSQGVLENDLMIISISLKMSKILELKKEIKMAEKGYIFCIENLESHFKKDSEDKEIQEMLHVALFWYAQMLLQLNRFAESHDLYLRCYNMSKEMDDPQLIELALNGLGSTSFGQEKYDEAVKYYSATLTTAKSIPDAESLHLHHVNLGDTYLRKGLYNEAKKYCEEGRRLAKQSGDIDVIHKANECLKDVKKLFNP